VSRRRGRHQRKSGASGETQHHNKNTNTHQLLFDKTEDLLMIPDVIVPQLEQCIPLLQSSDFYQNLKTLLFCPPENDVVFRRIVCYGLGSVITKSTTVMSASLWQLALLKCIDKDFGMATSPSSPPSSSSLYKRVVFYDPCTLPMEHELLHQFFPEITILPTNHRGKIRLIEDNDKEIGDDDGLVLFYMPHCPMLLYEHVLWSHWDEFVQSKVMILGNSLHDYAIQRTIPPPPPPQAAHHQQQHSKSRASSAVMSSSSLPPCLTIIVGLSPSSSTNSSGLVVTEQLVECTRDDLTNLPGHFERAFNDLYLIRCNGAMLDSDCVSLPRPPEHVMDSTHEMDERELL
jgi:hypothetical protein